MQRANRFILAAVVSVTLAAPLFLLSYQDANAVSPGPPFIAFESGHVRPLAMSPDGKTLFAVNTPNGTLEIFGPGGRLGAQVTRVPVGLEPVAVAARTNTEVWVVNHLSDSVSVVTLEGVPHVTHTLLVGDEPRDIVFAGNPQRAFITTAHRGQHRTDPSIASVSGAGDPQLTTPGVPRADVWVFDPANLGTTLGATPVKIVSLFADTPRALAVSKDRNTVYVAAFHSGNQTTTVLQDRICVGFDPNTPCTLNDGTISPGGNPGPKTNAAGEPAPEVGLIVRMNNQTGHWEDELHRNWDGSVRFNLPDKDVFAIDANTLTETASFAHMGTTLFNMAVNPANGKIYVTNTEAFNEVRFEGSGKFAGHTVQGHLAESRITILSGSTVTPRRLNKHIDYSALAGSPDFDPSAKNHSLSTPLEMAISSDGATLYVAAFGSSKVGVFDTAALEDDSFDPKEASASYIPIGGGGVSGLVLDEARGVLYAMTRFDNAVKTIDLATRKEIAAWTLPNPEPVSVIEGRPMLYDATRFSGNGEATCASCHIFGDMDDLAWDLGDPDARVTKSPIQIIFGNVLPLLAFAGVETPTPLNGSNRIEDFHPMKGPFTTQTLRGMRYSGAMHWRGDRSVGVYGTHATDAKLSFKNFVVAFEGLIGSPELPTEADMNRFADFQLQVLPPPNPVRNLDNSLTPAQARGAGFYSGSRPSDGVNNALADALFGKVSFNCNGCHELDASKGFFGTGTKQSFEALPQIVKIPHLRNMYAKVGMFGSPASEFFDQADSGPMGDQVRGFGFLGDGSTDTLFRFFTAGVFRPTANSGFPQVNPDGTRRDVEQFMLAFDSDLAPIVGQQVTLTADNAASANPRVDLLLQRAGAPFVSKSLGGTVMECEVIATFVRGGRTVTMLYNPVSRKFMTQDRAEPMPIEALRQHAETAGQEVTFTAVTPGSGARYLKVEVSSARPAGRR